MKLEQDPILKGLAKIEAKLDNLAKNQQEIQTDLQKIRADCEQIAQKQGGLAGGIVGAVVSAAINFIVQIKTGG